MQQVAVFKEIIASSEFFVLEDLDQTGKGNEQDMGAQEAAIREFDLPTEFFQYFQVEKAAA